MNLKLFIKQMWNKVFLIIGLMLFIIPFHSFSQCNNDNELFHYEYDVLETENYIIPEGFDFSNQLQTDLISIRDRNSKLHRTISIDGNYQMTENIIFIDSKNIYEEAEKRLIQTTYTYEDCKLLIESGLRSNRERVIKNDSIFKIDFYSKQIEYLNKNFGWAPINEAYYMNLENLGYQISFPATGVIRLQKDDVIMQYDTLNYIIYSEYLNDGAKVTYTNVFYKNAKGYIVPLMEVYTQTITLYSGDCVKKVIKRVIPPESVSLCWSESQLMEPRNSDDDNAEDFYIYPNPVKNLINLNNPFKGEDILVKILDVKGREVYNN